MRMVTFPRRSRAALALVAGLGLGAVSITGAPPPAASAAPGPCGPLGTLVTFPLNDRCDFGTGVNPMNVSNKAVVDALAKAGLFATRITCRNGAIVPVVAAPNQLLVAGSTAERLQAGLANVRRLLDNQVIGEPRPVNALASLLTVRPGTITPTFMRTVVPTLQGRGFSADLNYFEPAMPKNAFHPFDNPLEARPPQQLKGGRGSVLVVDSPAPSRATDYDVENNGKIDEDHGHGPFVVSLVKLLAPLTEVVLAPVNGRRVPNLARWSPMMFSDADLIRAMGRAFGLNQGGTTVGRGFDVVNLSLGGVGCAGIAARLPLGRFMRDLAGLAAKAKRITPQYVAASGNDGADTKHFPAAWRDKPTIEAAADAVDLALGGGAPTLAGNQIRQIQAFLQANMYAVGSWTAGIKDSFSNCGPWVNAIADGARAIGQYPSKTGWASWSGTSFATPRVSAFLVGGANPGDIDVTAVVATCPLLPLRDG
jgi:Subtilase family